MTILGIGTALLSAALYAVGVALQAAEARRTEASDALHLSLLRHLVVRGRWLVGTACVLGGWGAQAVALGLAPIGVVQATLATSVVGLLAVAARWFGHRVRPVEVAAAVAIVVGVAGLAAVAPPEGESSTAAVPLALVLGVLGALALAPYALRGAARRGDALALGAGVAYAWVAVGTAFLADALKAGAWVGAVAWLVGAAVAALLGLLSEMTALQRRSPVRVFPVVLVAQVLLAALLGPLLAGEPFSTEPADLVVLAAALVVLVLGTAALARSSAVGRVVAADA